jgi:hypothetical protein
MLRLRQFIWAVAAGAAAIADVVTDVVVTDVVVVAGTAVAAGTADIDR